jgi:hypothetical protein
MTRHLTKCLQEHESAEPAAGKKAPRRGKLFHLVVQGRGAPEYWLHLEVPETAPLYDLDAFLRHIWLECCGHLSQFTIDGVRYSVQPMDDAFGMAWADREERDMNATAGEVFRPGLTFTHEYDFGSTTELTLKLVGEREGVLKNKDAIRLLARNDPPMIPCGSCGAPAVWIDMERAWDASGWLCAKCAKMDPEDEYDDMMLPVVNSPRTGVCGYTGT